MNDSNWDEKLAFWTSVVIFGLGIVAFMVAITGYLGKAAVLWGISG